MSSPEVLPAPILDLQYSSEDKWQREYQAFLRLLPGLLGTHRNQYVAVHEGQVVGHGDHLPDVALAAYRQFGYVPIYVGLVTDQRPPPVRVPSPRVLESESQHDPLPL